MVNGMLSRRRLLQGLLAVPFIGIASAAVPRRVAILDWGLAELALALGVTPAAVSAPDWYRKLINVPPMSSDVADIGLLFQPNLEALYALRPDNILVTPQHALLKPILERIAPVVTLPVNGLAGYTAATKQMATLFDRQPQADALIQHLQQQMARTHDIAAGLSRPLFLAFTVNSLHVRLLGEGCVPGDVLAGCGIANAWRAPFPPGGESLIELTQIAQTDARLLLLTADDDEYRAAQSWQANPLWQRLPLTSGNNLRLAPTHFSSAGALVTASRFAAMLGTLLTGWDHD